MTDSICRSGRPQRRSFSAFFQHSAALMLWSMLPAPCRR
jgi:hypothetical protein